MLQGSTEPGSILKKYLVSFLVYIAIHPALGKLTCEFFILWINLQKKPRRRFLQKRLQNQVLGIFSYFVKNVKYVLFFTLTSADSLSDIVVYLLQSIKKLQ